MPGLLLTACHALQAPTPDGTRILADCKPIPQIQAIFAEELARGRIPEASATGACVADAARHGSPAAALLLAAGYDRAMTAAPAAGDAPHLRAPALGLDLFGRRVEWLYLAARQGDPLAQSMLAQAMDSDADRAMTDEALAWYQAAAENGDQPALAAIAAAYANGRILPERLYDLRKWLRAAGSAPTYRQTARLLAAPPARTLPG